MDAVLFQSLVSSVGFPIAVAVALFWQNFKHHEMYNKTFGEFKEVINQNNANIDSMNKLINELIRKNGER